MTRLFILLAIAAAVFGVVGVVLLLSGAIALGIILIGFGLILALGVHRKPDLGLPPEQRP